MLLAQLQRKVPHEFEGMEDVLTASVLGLLKYLPPELALRILAQIADLPLLQGEIQLELWPRHPTPPGFYSATLAAKPDEEDTPRGDTEPDARIETEDWLVLVEAKFRSALDPNYDQLGREFAIGYGLATDAGLQFRLLVITGHTLQPAPGDVDLVTGTQQALTAASARQDEAAARMISSVPDSLRWTSWQKLYSTLSEAGADHSIPSCTRRLLEDICRLLELRGLKPYDRRPLHRVLARWENAGMLDDGGLIPMAYHYGAMTSLTSGWDRLLQADLAELLPLEWQLESSLSDSDPGVRLRRFELGPLRSLMWRPFQ